MTMKKIALVLFALLAPAPAFAGVSCSLPFNLQNGTTADATQVMANYNALVACFGNAAASGVNNDITALAALSTPLTPAQGGTSVFVGATSTGSANAQILTSVVPSVFALTAGYQFTFIAGFTPTGPMTLQIGASAATNVYRRSQLGISPTVGGEFVVGQLVTVQFDGTHFQIVSTSPDAVGEIRDWGGSTAPAGWAFIDGSCQSRTTFADLFTVIGTAYDPTGSTCDTAHFALPDGRGRVMPGYDAMGQGAAGRLTTSGCTVVGGAGCGTQAATIAQANIPNYALTITTAHTQVYQSATGITYQAGGNAISYIDANAGQSSAPLAGGLNSGGSGTPLTTLPPMQVVSKIIKY